MLTCFSAGDPVIYVPIRPYIYVPIRYLYICRESSTNQPFLCKTNPILSAVGGLQMNLKLCYKMTYQNFIPLAGYKNKPKTNLVLSALSYPECNRREWANLRNAQNELKIACQNLNCRYNNLAAGPCVSRRKSGQRE